WSGRRRRRSIWRSTRLSASTSSVTATGRASPGRSARSGSSTWPRRRARSTRDVVHERRDGVDPLVRSGERLLARASERVVGAGDLEVPRVRDASQDRAELLPVAEGVLLTGDEELRDGHVLQVIGAKLLLLARRMERIAEVEGAPHLRGVSLGQ